jgi:TatD DNase family protein
MLKDRSPSEAIAEAKTHGIERFLTIGTDSVDHPTVLKLAQEFDEVFCTLGVHPHDAEDFKNAKDWMLENLSHPKVVAVGEIGLDFFYDNAPRELQMEVFREQMEIAAKHNLPVQIHTRDAEKETAEVLHEFKGRVKGILHCFSSSRWLAEEGLAAGFNISISGIVTFKSAQDLRDTIKDIVPLDRIHVETDAPFLAPIPCRGKENHSSYMMHTAAVVADLKGVSMEELMKATTQNNLELFTKLK